MKRILLMFLLGVLCMAGCEKRYVSSVESIESKIQPESEAESEAVLESEPESEWKTESEEEKNMERTDARIVCWGDSLTFGEGGNGVTFPLVLEELTGFEVINYGVQGETARQIGIRMGVFPMSTGAFEIPAETAPVEVSLRQSGEDPIMMRLGDCGINPCRVAGVEGTLAYHAEDNKYYFTRLETGSACTVEEGTEVETFASGDKRASDIVILFAGSNLAPDRNTVSELINTEKQMLDYLEADRYLVIGLTSLAMVPDVEPINEALAAEFGEHFLDIRAYLLENGLQDAGIEPTKQDKKDLRAGEIPSSLRVDIVHGTEDFYRIIGEQIYRKLEQAGYLEERN